MSRSDRVNALILPEEVPVEDERYHPHTRARGVDLMYDPQRSKMTIKIRYEDLHADNPVVLEELGIEPRHGGLNALVGDNQADNVKLGDLFEVESVLYRVTRFQGGGAVCEVLESDNPNVAIIGSLKAFTMAGASGYINDFNS